MNCSMFDLYKQDIDEVIMTINFYLMLGEEENAKPTTTKAPMKPAAKNQNRIRVNDATATGGWF